MAHSAVPVADVAGVEVIDAATVADAGTVQLADELRVALTDDLCQDMRLERHALPQQGLEGISLLVAGIPRHEDGSVGVRHHGRELEEVAHEHDLLLACALASRKDHVHHALEQVDAAHAHLVDDDDLRLLQDLAGERPAIRLVGVEQRLHRLRLTLGEPLPILLVGHSLSFAHGCIFVIKIAQ